MQLSREHVSNQLFFPFWSFPFSLLLSLCQLFNTCAAFVFVSLINHLFHPTEATQCCHWNCLASMILNFFRCSFRVCSDNKRRKHPPTLTWIVFLLWEKWPPLAGVWLQSGMPPGMENQRTMSFKSNQGSTATGPHKDILPIEEWFFTGFVIQLSALRLASLDANSQQQNLQKMIQSRKQQQKRNHMNHHCAHSFIFAKRMWSLHLKSLEFWFSFESICCKNSCAANNNTEFVFRFACATMCLVTITNWNHHVVTLIILLQVEDLDRVSPKDAKPVNEFRSYSQHICTHENGRKTSRCSKDLRLTIDFETISDLFPGLKTFGSNLDLCLDLQN